MRRQIVIGLGETGAPLREVLGCAGYDSKNGKHDVKGMGPVEVLHICIPYMENFVGIVKGYQADLMPDITVIHSTVPIGTTAKITNAVHSPILGMHNNMAESIRNFTKWIGGASALRAAGCFTDAGIKVKCVEKASETEALKLICLAKYGMSIAFAGYIKTICNSYDFPYMDVMDWDNNYNENVLPYLQRPVIIPPEGKIGGHCVIPGTKILNGQHPNKILAEILEYV